MPQVIRTVLEVDARPASAGFATAEKAAGGYGKSLGTAERAVAGYSDALNDMFDKLDQRKHWDNLANNALVAGGALAIGLGGTVKVAADFEQAMDRVGAVSDASSSQMQALSTAALKAGEDTVFSASEAAQAQEELAKAGVSTADILGGALTGSLDLAAAGGLDLASSAEIAAQSMNLFGLEGEDVTHIADVLTAAANKSAAGVDDLGLALSQGGTVAASTGLTLEETAATLSAFADSGMKGSDAGTSLKTMLQRLSAPSGEAADLMDQLGVSAYDAAGEFVGMETLAGQLRGGLEKLTPAQRNSALATMFGSDAVRAANILYKEGAAGMAEYVTAVDDQGAAARMAARMTDNLRGDVEELGGALETAFIKTGSSGAEGLRGAVQGIEGVVSAYNDLPPAAQSAVFNIGAVSAAALLAGGATIKAVGFVKDLDESLKAVGFSATTTKGRMTALAKVAAVPMLGYATKELRDYTQAGELADVSIDDLSKGFMSLAGGSGEATAGLADMFRQHDQGVSALFRSEEQYVSTAEAIERFGNMANEATRTDLEGTVARWMEGTGAFDESVTSADASLAKMVETGHRAEAIKAFDKLLGDVDPDKVEKVRGEFVKFQEALDSTGPAAGAVREALSGVDDELDSNKDGWVTATEEVEAHEKALEDLQSQLEQLGGGFRAEQAASREVADSVREMQAAAKDNAGWSELSAAMDQTAGDALSFASAQVEMGRGSDVIANGIRRAREQVIQAGVDAGRSRPFMEAYANSIGLIPSEAKTMVEAVGVTESTANVMAMDEQIQLLSGKTVSVKQAGAMEAKGKVLELDGAVLGLNDKTVKVTEIGSTASGDRVVQLGNKIWVLKGKDVDVTARTHGEEALVALQGQIDRMNGRNIDVNTYYTEHRKTVDMGTWKAKWAGGIEGVDPMAAGGMRPAGSVRPGIYGTSKRGILMAEDTRSKWESYIPERPDLRGRAEAILEETARRFGKAVVPLEGVAAMASGGVYSRWQKELRDVRGLSNRYRWEDGSRMIEIFEDGTARWRGYGAAPSNVAREIAQLNAAQDLYEDAKRRQSQPKTKTKKPFQHSPQYWVDQRRFAENRRKAAEKKAGQRTSHDTKGSASSGNFDRKTWAGDAFKRSDQRSKHLSRTYVAPRSTGPSISSTSSSPTHVTITDRQFARLEKATERGAYRGAYAGTAQKTKSDLAQTATAPRGRSRGGSL